MTIVLPLVGSHVESASRDIKADYRQDQPLASQKYELAKDIAAMANGIGGQLIIGAHEDRKTARLGRYEALSRPRLKELGELADLAVKELLRPPPIFESHVLPPPDSDVDGVLVLEVQPFPGQAVGLVVKTNDGVSFRFPVRVGSRTVFYFPEQLGLLMDPRYRRTIQLLHAALESRQAIYLVINGNPHARELIGVSEVENSFSVNDHNAPRNGDGSVRHPERQVQHFAIDQVRFVHRGGPNFENKWIVAIEV